MNEFRVGDRVKIRDNSEYRHQAYRNGGDGIGVIYNIKHHGFPLQIKWNNGDINNYQFQDVELILDLGKKRLEKPEIDPFGEEYWGYEIKENINFSNIRDYYIPFNNAAEMINIAKYLKNCGEDVFDYDKVIGGIGYHYGYVYVYNRNYQIWMRSINYQGKIKLSFDDLLKVEMGKKMKIKKPELDPFGEEEWYIQESIRNFEIGDTVIYRGKRWELFGNKGIIIGESQFGDNMFIVEFEKPVEVYKNLNPGIFAKKLTIYKEDLDLYKKCDKKKLPPEIDPFNEEF